MKKLQSIYELLKKYGYTREQIDEMLSKLSDKDKHIVYLRYGDNLDKPTTSPEWDYEKNDYFYGILLPKMKKLLANSEYKFRNPSSPKQINQNPESTEMAKQEQPANVSNSNSMQKEDYAKILELLRSASFEQLVSVLSLKEAVIISLKLGFVNDKYFSTESIANFLGIEEKEVRETTKKVLLVYSENINQFIDTAIQVVTNEADVLKKER